MSIPDPHDTIAAVASPPGPGVRGLIRVTGPSAIGMALAIFRVDGTPPSARLPTWSDGAIRLSAIGRDLPAHLATWPGSRTYTGQPLAEVHTIGSPPLLDLILAELLARGARPAEPGEFTLRAFLSGRLDLTRAEAVLGVIDARNRRQLDASLRQLAGGLATPLEALRDRLLDLLAHLEAGLDFVDEHDVDPLAQSALADELDAAAATVEALAGQLQARDRPDVRPRVVLVGAPNAGKSRLFNALVGDDRAIVSPVAGTTRDYLSAACDCDGLVVELVDTAGRETADDAIGSRAQGFRDEQATGAMLRLFCVPAGETSAPADDDGRGLRVATKCDLGAAPADALPTSAASGQGLDALRAAIAATLRAGDAEADPLAGSGARCRDSLERAGGALRSAAATRMLGGGDELVAIDLRLAVDELGRVVGAVVTDDILDRIFRRFCIGK